MNILVFVETSEGKARKTSLEAVAYAHGMGGAVTAIVLGAAEANELQSIGKYGATKVLHAADPKLNEHSIQVYASVLAKAMQDENAEVLVLANSALGTPVAAKVAIKTGASFASNVTERPDTSAGFVVKRSIYTGKAFALVEMKNARKVIAIRKNAAELKEAGGNAQVTPYPVTLNDADFNTKTLSTENATRDILLSEAKIVGS